MQDENLINKKKIRNLVLVTNSDTSESTKLSSDNLTGKNSNSISRNYSLFSNMKKLSERNDNLSYSNKKAKSNLTSDDNKIYSSLKLPVIHHSQSTRNQMSNKFTFSTPVGSEINKKIFSFHKSLQTNKIKIKKLNFSSGSKYLLNNPESVFITNHKIKQSVDELSKINSFIPKEELTKRKIHSLSEEVEQIPLNEQNFCRRKIEQKLFIPVKGMNYLRRIISLDKGEPYFYINKFYKNEDIENNNLLLSLFEKNNSGVQKVLIKK